MSHTMKPMTAPEEDVHYFDHIHEILLRYAQNGQATELLTMLSLPQIHDSPLFWRTCTYQCGITAALLSAAIESRRANGAAYPHLLLLDDASSSSSFSDLGTAPRSHRPLRESADAAAAMMTHTHPDHRNESEANYSSQARSHDLQGYTPDDDPSAQHVGTSEHPNASPHRQSADPVTCKAKSLSLSPAALRPSSCLSVVDLYMLLQCCARQRDAPATTQLVSGATVDDNDNDDEDETNHHAGNDVTVGAAAAASSPPHMVGTEEVAYTIPTMTDMVLKDILHVMEQPPRRSGTAADTEPTRVGGGGGDGRHSSAAPPRASIDLAMVIVILREACRDMRYVNPLQPSTTNAHKDSPIDGCKERLPSSTPSPQPPSQPSHSQSPFRPLCGDALSHQRDDGEEHKASSELIVSSSSSSSSSSSCAAATDHQHHPATKEEAVVVTADSLSSNEREGKEGLTGRSEAHKRRRACRSGEAVDEEGESDNDRDSRRGPTVTALSAAAKDAPRCVEEEERTGGGQASRTDGAPVSSSPSAVELLQSLTPLTAQTCRRTRAEAVSQETTRAAQIRAFNVFNDAHEARVHADGGEAAGGRMSGSGGAAVTAARDDAHRGEDDDRVYVDDVPRMSRTLAEAVVAAAARERRVIRRRVHFTAEEDAAILQGIARFGLGVGRFQCIFQAYRDVWMPGRTPIKLYDHWRDALRHRAVHMLDVSPSSEGGVVMPPERIAANEERVDE